jgi:3-methyladenine DNA glycosylase AlkD/tRNA(Arg) A34 adenosine deaminase TadA
MAEALREARRALSRGDRPIGAVLVCRGTIVARDASRAALQHDPLRHAETEVLHKAASLLLQRSAECTLYTTVEPCAMCLGAIAAAGVPRVVFGLEDRWAGATRLIPAHPYFQSHIREVRGGILREESLELYRRFSEPGLELVLTGRGTSVQDAVAALRSASDPHVLSTMDRAGIRRDAALGVTLPAIRQIAAHILPRHRLAEDLWSTGIHEARLLAALVDKVNAVTPEQMEQWAQDFDSWDLCDCVCSNLFDKTPYAVAKITAWTTRDDEFVKRAGFVLMASLAVHDKELSDAAFEAFFPLIEEQAWDNRAYVRKSVNWALRQTGKRNLHLNDAARASALRIQAQNTSSAKWIAADALRELQSPSVHERLERWSRDPRRP